MLQWPLGQTVFNLNIHSSPPEYTVYVLYTYYITFNVKWQGLNQDLENQYHLAGTPGLP